MLLLRLRVPRFLGVRRWTFRSARRRARRRSGARCDARVQRRPRTVSLSLGRRRGGRVRHPGTAGRRGADPNRRAAACGRKRGGGFETTRNAAGTTERGRGRRRARRARDDATWSRAYERSGGGGDARGRGRRPEDGGGDLGGARKRLPRAAPRRSPGVGPPPRWSRPRCWGPGMPSTCPRGGGTPCGSRTRRFPIRSRTIARRRRVPSTAFPCVFPCARWRRRVGLGGSAR